MFFGQANLCHITYIEIGRPSYQGKDKINYTTRGDERAEVSAPCIGGFHFKFEFYMSSSQTCNGARIHLSWNCLEGVHNVGLHFLA